ncbi:Protein of unknown function [Pyronema omphalodes CBS 100304]|uniref:F-box domain-containing protein n=1 Tax=Pyronema omphalodes (strain CBS 100304) TaxID=1076935 RepID=U4L0B0_PYROM|nr:Protein of unknown function [Pyronema omphalodes CBS 100304]
MVHPVDGSRPEVEKLFDLNFDVMYLCFEYVNEDDLKNMALVCKKISQHALRYMHTHLTWVLHDNTLYAPIPEKLDQIQETVICRRQKANVFHL